ncbi:TPA: hypothetical protein ACMDVI_003633, partial [Vibrio cholerae]
NEVLSVKYIYSLLILIIMSSKSWAGCDEVSSQCLVIDSDKESFESCEIAICANMSEYLVNVTLENGGRIFMRDDSQTQVINVNGSKGVTSSPPTDKSNLTCYAIADMSVTYCIKDSVL